MGTLHPDRALDTARQMKHRIFVAHKHARWALGKFAVALYDRRWARTEDRRPFEYLPDYYPHTFLARAAPSVSGRLDVPRRIFVIWFGGHPMNGRRRDALAIIRNLNAGIPVELVTEESLDRWKVPGAIFHPGFDHLSAVHKSDYVRAYLMHHHGGGYCDVKALYSGWSGVFDTLDSSPEAVAAGYREVTSSYTPDLPRVLGAHLKRHYRAVFGTSGFVFRPGSSFTAEWMRELDARMDYYSPALREAPGQDGYDPDPAYPIRWTEILGDIVQPLCLKHQSRLVFDDRLKPSLKDYR